MSKKWNGKVPFKRHADGQLEMMEYSYVEYPFVKADDPRRNCYAADVWLDAKPFAATLEVTSAWKGRSAARFGVRDVTTGVHYSMGFYSFYEVVSKLRDGQVTGVWNLKKQGTTYGLVSAEEA